METFIKLHSTSLADLVRINLAHIAFYVQHDGSTAISLNGADRLVYVSETPEEIDAIIRKLS